MMLINDTMPHYLSLHIDIEGRDITHTIRDMWRRQHVGSVRYAIIIIIADIRHYHYHLRFIIRVADYH